MGVRRNITPDPDCVLSTCIATLVDGNGIGIIGWESYGILLRVQTMCILSRVSFSKFSL